MTKSEYQSFKPIKDLLIQIRKAINEKEKIQENNNLTSEDKAERIAQLSNDIMAAIMRLHLWVRNDYIDEFRNGTVATINPADPRVKLSLEKGEEKYYTLIKANSCGPFNSKMYFMPNVRGKVQILKESYITKERYDDKKCPDRGGHNPADYYSTWEKIEANGEAYGTKGKFVDLIKTLDEKIDGIEDENTKTDNEAMNEAMKSICFLQLNLFPGLSLNDTASDDELIKKWAEYNGELLEALIEFYSPEILIGAGKTVNVKIQEIIESFNIPLNSYYAQYDKYEYNIVKYNKGFIFIPAYHPAYRAVTIIYELMKSAGNIIRIKNLLKK